MNSKILESFLIPEDSIATEGIIGDIIGKEERRIRKLMKENKGKSYNYGKDAFNIFNWYQNNINYVLEPSEYSSYLSQYSQIHTLCGKIYDLIKLRVSSESESLLSKFIEESKKIKPIKIKVNKKSDNLVKSKLESSNMFKLYCLMSEDAQRLNNIDYNYNMEYQYNLEYGGELDSEGKFKDKCARLIETLIDNNDTYTLITNCEFVTKGTPVFKKINAKIPKANL